MTQPNDDSWFVFSITETDGVGVEVPKLARLLEHLSAALYAIARSKIGAGVSRPGPRTATEDALAAVRLVRIVQGSTTIEFAPPEVALQTVLPEPDSITADTLVSEFFDEVRQIEAGESVQPERWEVRRRVREVVEDAGQIGARGELRYRPLVATGIPEVSRVTFRTREIPIAEPPHRASRTRRVVGHAFMVDVEPGRQRIRLKMPDGRDITVEVDQELLASIPGALDRVVELQVEEEIEGGAVTSRTVRSLGVLPSSGPGSDRPPKSIEQLVKEQRIQPERPDYVAIASGIWPTEEDVARFEEHVASMRKAEAS